MKLFVLISLLLAIACNPKVETKSPKQYGPLCALANATPDLMLCIEYKKGTATDVVETECARERLYYQSIGATRYLVSGASSTYCDTVLVSGKCVFTDRVITFYTAGFPDSEGECSSRGGTFQRP